MSAQTSYNILQGKYYEGQIIDLGPRDVVSRDVETVLGIGFGIAVSRGTNKERQIVLGGDDVFLGVTVRELTRENAINTNVVGYAETETAGVMRAGYIAVTCPTGCNPGDTANYVDATGVIDSGIAIAGETDITGATWETVTVAGEVGILRLVA